MPSRIGVGLIGAGRIGREHAAILASLPGVQVAAVADPDQRAAAAAAAGCPGARAVGDVQALLDQPGIDAVVICSPTNTHAPLIERAAGARRHVFCEKPIALEVESVRSAIAAVERAGVQLQVGFNRRFDPQFRRLADAVRGGRIGVPHLIRITSRDPAPPSLEYARASGGIFLDMTIHDLDMARFLAGDEVVEVSAVGSTLIDARLAQLGDVDTAITTLRFRGGALCAIDNSRRAEYGYDQRVEVFGSAGCLNAGNGLPAAPGKRTGTTPLDLSPPGGAQPAGASPGFFLERYHDSYRAEMQAFVDCVRDGRTPPVTGRDGLIALLLAVAAKRSRDEGRPVQVEPA